MWRQPLGCNGAVYLQQCRHSQPWCAHTKGCAPPSHPGLMPPLACILAPGMPHMGARTSGTMWGNLWVAMGQPCLPPTVLPQPPMVRTQEVRHQHLQPGHHRGALGLTPQPSKYQSRGALDLRDPLHICGLATEVRWSWPYSPQSTRAGVRHQHLQPGHRGALGLALQPSKYQGRGALGPRAPFDIYGLATEVRWS